MPTPTLSTVELRRAAVHAGTTIRTLDLFAGAGGLTAGLHEATRRFQPVRAVELEAAAAATYALNHGGSIVDGELRNGVVYVGGVETWLADDVVPDVDVVVGGPPCQGFSTLGKRQANDGRNLLWREYARTVARAKPQYFVLENVPAFLKSEQFDVFSREFALGGLLANYAFEAKVLNAADYGSAQARKRVIVIGHHKDLPAPGHPAPTHPKHRTVAEALLGVPVVVPPSAALPEGQVLFADQEFPGPFSSRQLHVPRRYTQLSLDRFAHIPPGGNRLDLPDHLKAPCWLRHSSGAGDVMGRLRWNRPSVTIRTEFFKPEKGRYLHPDEDRVITHYEAALLQGFKPDYQWIGTRDAIARQIGNAVPLELGAAIGHHLVTALGNSAMRPS